MIRSVLPLVFLAAVQFVWPQTDDRVVRLRLAQGFEQAGEWERAVGLYESLHREDPANYVYFDGLRRGYVQLKEYRKAEELILSRLGTQKEDAALLSALGGIYYQMGQESKADSIWRDLLSRNYAHVNVYRLVASQQIEFRLYEEAIRTFLEARRATGNETLFVEDLANLYGAFQQYDNYAAEYARLLRSQPQQLSYVQSRLSILLNRGETLKPIHDVIRQEVAKTPAFVPLRQLNAWLYVEGKNYDAALEEYRRIDRLTSSAGSELLQFAGRAMKEGAYAAAAKALGEVIERHPSGAAAPMARFQYARALEELGRNDTTISGGPEAESSGETVSETRPTAGAVIDLYLTLVRDFPRTDIAARSLFRIGIIRKERQMDFDGALEAFERVRTMLPGSPLATDAALEIGELHVLKNALSQARREYAKLVGQGDPAIRDRARFRMAELDYYEGKFDTALTVLKTLVSNVQADLANDALALQYFIQENTAGSRPALQEFARADLLFRQRKLSEALSKYRFVVQTYPAVYLIDEAYIRIADLLVLMKRPGEALDALMTIMNQMPLSIVQDRAYLKAGELYERMLKNPAKAAEIYGELLSKFPHSVYAEEARRRIRIIRGDNL